MKICKDCTVSLSLKGLDGHTGTIAVPLSNNNGDAVELVANAECPDAKMDDIMFIGKDAGDSWEFTFGGVNGKLLLPKSNDVDRFDVKMELVFDPAVDCNWTSLAKRDVTVNFGEQAGSSSSTRCYLVCDDETFCGYSPFCVFCDGFFLKC